MRTILATLALLAGLALGAPETVAQTSPCQASTTGAVGGIPCQGLPGRFYAPGAGTGIESEAILATGTADDTTFLRGDGTWEVPVVAADGVLATAVWSTANQTLTLTLADGTTIPVALSGLETQAEVSAAIAAAIANRLTRSDIIAGNNITLTPGTGNQVTIAAAEGGRRGHRRIVRRNDAHA